MGKKSRMACARLPFLPARDFFFDIEDNTVADVTMTALSIFSFLDIDFFFPSRSPLEEACNLMAWLLDDSRIQSPNEWAFYRYHLVEIYQWTYLP